MLFDLTWKNCNYIAHSSNVQDMARKISQIADEHWINQRHKLLVSNYLLSSKAWTKPKDGWIKINIDARFKDGIAITAVIIRTKMVQSSLLTLTSTIVWIHLPLKPWL